MMNKCLLCWPLKAYKGMQISMIVCISVQVDNALQQPLKARKGT